MDEKKQIEEMARDLCKNISCTVEEWSECSLHRTDGFCARCKGLAERLYNAGHCKGSELVWEIFDKVDEIAYRYLNDADYSAGDMIYDLNELKKEYTEGIYAKKVNRNM